MHGFFIAIIIGQVVKMQLLPSSGATLAPASAVHWHQLLRRQARETSGIWRGYNATAKTVAIMYILRGAERGGGGGGIVVRNRSQGFHKGASAIRLHVDA